MDEKELLDLLLEDNLDPKMIDPTNDRERRIVEALSKKESSTTREVIIEICLADYHTATARERVRIVGSLSNWAFTRESAWDTLVELVDREPMTPILKDSFVLPVLREERKRPSKSSRRPRKDERDFRIFTAVNVLTKYHGYSLTKAYKAVAKAEKESSYQTIRSKYRKMRDLQPFKRSKKPQ